MKENVAFFLAKFGGKKPLEIGIRHYLCEGYVMYFLGFSIPGLLSIEKRFSGNVVELRDLSKRLGRKLVLSTWYRGEDGSSGNGSGFEPMGIIVEPDSDLQELQYGLKDRLSCFVGVSIKDKKLIEKLSPPIVVKE